MNYTGLNEKQVIESREKYGSNKLPEPPMKRWYQFAAETLKDKITLILIFIAIVQGIFSFFGLFEISEPVMILLVLGIVVSINVKTNLGIQKSSRELKEKTSRRFCNVIRDGSVKNINKDDLVVGDIVLLETGNEIFADGYIIAGSISVSNAAINGESKECKKTPVEGYIYKKSTSTDDYTNQNSLFAGTTIMSGEGRMVVTDVGTNTVNGDTLVKMQTLEAPKTSLQIALDNLANFISRWGTIAAFIAFCVMTASGIAQLGFEEYFGTTPLEAIRTIATNISIAMTIIVAAVPEGLPLIIQLVTKQNVKTMERFNILAKNPNKIPELANVNLICTDKTGTLTTGIMTPKKFVLGNRKEIELGFLPQIVANNLTLNNSSRYDDNCLITGGNSIDRAVLSLVKPDKCSEIMNNVSINKRLAFNSAYKFSAVETSVADGVLSYYKGAPEKIIQNCSYYLNEDSQVCDLTYEMKALLEDKIKSLTTMSMRCIALATSDKSIPEDDIPSGMVLSGVIGVVDPVRKEVPYAVKTAHKAGIQVIEITGDCIETAVAIAKESGIYGKPGDVAITDKEFTEMSDDEVKAIIPKLRVIARCSPTTKLRLVTLAQEIGYSVAMTGDGTNDSPALKRSDVGFAMNAGTDVAKEAGDIILTDNNFASVVKGVELGRTFMHNIMMFLDFQLPINISLLIMNLLYPIFWVGSILTSVQILVVNIIMDSLNSLSFGGEPPKEAYMKEKPIKKGSGLFVGDSKERIATGTITFIAVYAAMLLSPIKEMFGNADEALAARFALLCLIAVFNGFNIRTDNINLFSGLKNNKLFAGIAVGIIAGAVMLTQFGGKLIHTAPLSVEQWGIIFVLSLVVIPVDLIRKAIKKVRKR